MNEALVSWLGSVTRDPLAFVMGAFPWREAGTQLEAFDGPEPWQRGVLLQVAEGLSLDRAIQLATASGHGVGKSALVSWLILWAMATKPDCRGVVTANTETQLKTKTWAELGRWYQRFIGKELFKLTATALFSADSAHERTWRIDMVPWSERNTEAFAGLHNQGRRILVLFDEASAIPDKIWETTEGALTDANTEIIWCVFGNPTRNTGRFKECFPGGRFSAVWRSRAVDSRQVSFTDKAQIRRWLEAYGEDSYFARVRVLGLFPESGEMEFFSSAEVDAAMAREVAVGQNEALALGVDVARYGSNDSVLFPRKGRDARSIPRRRFHGLDTMLLSNEVQAFFDQFRPDGIFIDGGGVGGGVVDNVRHRHLFCYEIQFGGKADSPGYATGNEGERYANKRAEMYGALRAWLKVGAIPSDQDLRQQLLSITYTLNRQDQILLTSKEEMMRDGKASPDDVDALAMTFAYPLASHDAAGGAHPQKPMVEFEYNPYAPERMAA
jgi:hypothetical protein